jgi:hypothetical protein
MARHPWWNRTYKPHRSLGPAGKHQQLDIRRMRYVGEKAGMTPKQAYMWAYLTTYESGGVAGKIANPGQVSTIDAGVGADMATPTAWMKDSGLFRKFERLGGNRGQRNPLNAAKLAKYDLHHGDPGWRSWTTGVNGTDPEFAKARARVAGKHVPSVLGSVPDTSARRPKRQPAPSSSVPDEQKVALVLSLLFGDKPATASSGLLQSAITRRLAGRMS